MNAWIRWSILAATLIAALAVSGPATSGERPALVGRTADGAEAAFTLARTEVAGEILSGWARIAVTQTWENPFTAPLEGVYRFPLPHDAAVDRVAMVVGTRLIEGQVMERERAEQVYEAARDEGRHAALTEEERPNVFTQTVANVMPGETILVTLRFVMPLALEDGEYTLALPTTIGPRYVPAHKAGDPAMARVTAPVLAAGEDPGHRLDVTLRIRPGLPLLGVHSQTHSIAVTHAAPDDATVTLDPDDRIPDKDLVLRYRVASRAPLAGVLATRSGEGPGTFALTVEPPSPTAGVAVRPRELVFVVDTSGSMMGEPVEKAKAVIRRALANLGAADTFQIINFSSSASSLSPTPLDRSPQNLRRGLQYVDHLAGEGGTEMLAGVRAALAGAPPAGRLRIVLFLTDGYIGNDAEVIDYVAAHIGQARLFALGVGSSVNRYLLDRLAAAGRGAVEYVTPYEPEDDVADRFSARIDAPVLTDIEIDWGGLPVHGISPLPIPDLFIGQPLRVLGRYERAAKGTVQVRGVSDGKEVTIDVPVSLPAVSAGMEMIETVWARREIDRITGDATPEQVRRATDLALEHRILSPWTSFVAVERDAVANPSPEQLRTALAAVYLPDGVEHAGIFGEPKPPALLTPDRIMPGDPDILVHAPRDARRVFALLPWGEPVICVWVEGEGAFMGRFLVPREAAEGLYPVRVYVEHADGTKQSYSLVYRVDFTAPVMELELPRGILAAGSVLSLRAIPIEGVYEGKAVRKVGKVTVRMRTDVKRVSVRVGDVQTLLAQTPRGEAWEGHLRLPETPGEYAVELVVTDFAGNSMRQTATVVVR
ncbi:MAG: hypothetical protein AMXMBFR64_28070 [Myxococcales bacterium]